MPNDVSLVVYGHAAAAASGVGRLPMIVYPVEEIARHARTLLLARFAGSKAPPRLETASPLFVEPRSEGSAP